MQARSNTWIQLAATGNAALIASVWIDGVLYPSTTAPAISRAAFPDSISLGNCVSATLQVTIRTDDGDSIAKAAPVVVKMKLQQDSTESEDLDAGTFFISRRSFDRVNNLLTLQCYDAMMKGNAAFPLIDLTEADFPMAMTEAIGYAAGKLGVTVDSRTWDYIQTGDDYVIGYPLGLSVKDVLGYIGSANGGNWIITPENKLRFVPVHGYSATGAASIEAVLSKINKNPSFTISRIIIGDKDGNEYMAGDSTGYVLDLGENPYATQGICDDLFAMLGGVEYLPFSISQGIYDPALEIGDCVSYGDDLEAVVYEESVTYNVAFRGSISAPQDAELEDEFPYMSPVKNLERDVTALDAKVDTKASYTDLDAVRIVVNAISADYLKASEAELTYATINLANVVAGSVKTAMIDTGAVQTAQIADGSITDAKIVTLTANKITAGTLSVERLEIRGSNTSLVYALNDITGALQSQNVDTINGEILTPRTITADRIVTNAITANEIAAGTITGNEIAANTITAGKLNVTTLSAITANMGTITGGLLQLGTNAITELKNDGTGHIGAWNFDAAKLYNGTYGADSSVYFSTANMASKAIGGRTGADWRLTIGSKFGVTNVGAVYSNALYASGGEIGGWHIQSDSLGAYTNNYEIWLNSSGQILIWKLGAGGAAVQGVELDNTKIRMFDETYVSRIETDTIEVMQRAGAGGSNLTVSTITPTNIVEGGTSLADKYLKLSGGTLYGDLTVDHINNALVIARSTDTVSVYLHADSSGLHGIYSPGYWNGTAYVSSGKRLVYRDTAGNVYCQGHATLDLPLTGGTLTGNLTVSRAGEGAVKVTNTSAGNLTCQLDTSTENHGIWSTGYYDNSTSTFTASGTWMIYRNKAGTVTVNGNVTGSAATAGALNTIASVSGSSHAVALQTYFNNNHANIPRNKLINFYSSAYNNGSLAMGYFLAGNDSRPYGGFFVAHYSNAYYVGISNGAYSEQKILTSTNYSGYALPLSGGTITGSLTNKTSYNAAAANNGISSGVGYPTTFNILDSADRIMVRLEGVINSNGQIGSSWYVRNYNTSGGQVAQKGIWMLMDKAGTLTYSVSDAANFRSAISAAASSHGNHVPATQTASNKVFLRNDNTWQTVTPANIGAAASSHTHSYLPLSGGTVTGATTFSSSLAVSGNMTNAGWIFLRGAEPILYFANNQQTSWTNRIRSTSATTLQQESTSGGAQYSISCTGTNEASCAVKNGGHSGVLLASSGNNFGLYSTLSGKTGWLIRCANNGTVTVSTSVSDIRLKQNIRDTDVKDARGVIDSIRIRQFDWIDTGEHQKIGFVADELEVLDPHMAFGGGEDEYGNMYKKNVDTFYLIGYLTKAVQELSARVKELEKAG